MKSILDTISREIFIAVIQEAHAHWKAMDDTIQNTTAKAQYKSDLLGATYHFLKKFMVYNSEAPMFNDILSPNDIELLKEINTYNYNKLIIAKRSSSL